jgi:FlaA1/EpsC-like NDP-sugar epimerase
MILIALAAHFYVDMPLRRWLKNFLQTISIRVFLLDLAIVALTAFFIFQVRFGDGREYRSYREMERLMFWVAFFAYPSLLLAFGAYRPQTIMKPGIQGIRYVFFPSLVSMVVVAASVYLGYFTGWFENFPRSIFVLEWLVIFSLFVLIRFAFRALKIYK